MSKKKKDSALSKVKSVGVSLLLGGNLLTLALLWACCLFTWVDPSLHPRVAAFELAFPVFLILNLLFIPLWLIFKVRMTVVPVLGIALCGGFVLDYCPLHFWNRGETEYDLKVMTWNCHNMCFYGGDSLKMATDYIVQSGADVVCLQEYGSGETKYNTFLADMESQGYHTEILSMLFFASRFPILSARLIALESAATNSAMMADLQMGDDTLTVFCVHLESYGLSDDDKDNYGHVLRAPERGAVETEVSHLSGKIGQATSFRARQTKRLVECLDSLPEGRAVLLCGDFNDTPISYAYQTLNKHLGNAYREGGFGVGISFNERNFPFRIDHIFHSSHWTCQKACIDRSMKASDHYPLVAWLRKQGK